MLVTWDDAQALGHDDVDHSHHLVIEAINLINEPPPSSSGQEESRRLLPLLEQSLSSHFQAEEKALAASRGQAIMATHRLEHDNFLNTLSALRREQDQGQDIAGLLLLNLVCFLMSHLRGTDLSNATPRPALRRAA